MNYKEAIDDLKEMVEVGGTLEQAESNIRAIERALDEMDVLRSALEVATNIIDIEIEHCPKGKDCLYDGETRRCKNCWQDYLMEQGRKKIK